MIVTILWEDQQGTVLKGFGPHELLLACVADGQPLGPKDLGRKILSHPKKGNGTLRRALQKDLHLLRKSGPVLAVIDRDKVLDLWKGQEPNNCLQGITGRFRQDARGEYELAFLIQNIETLVNVVCNVCGVATPKAKPTPDERDRLLMKAVRPDGSALREQIRRDCPSFDRLVTKVAAALK